MVFLKVLVWFFAAVSMQIISNIFSTILGVKITVLIKKKSFMEANLIINVKISDFDLKIVKNILEIICILTHEKNYTSNFPVTPFDPKYCTSSKAFLTAPSKQPYFQCILKIFRTFGEFFVIFNPVVLEYSLKFVFEFLK